MYFLGGLASFTQNVFWDSSMLLLISICSFLSVAQQYFIAWVCHSLFPPSVFLYLRQSLITNIELGFFYSNITIFLLLLLLWVFKIYHFTICFLINPCSFFSFLFFLSPFGQIKNIFIISCIPSIDLLVLHMKNINSRLSRDYTIYA